MSRFRPFYILALLTMSGCSHVYTIRANSPVHDTPVKGTASVEKESFVEGVCLSGGGYRAMLFHAGVLWRLNDAGLLRHVRLVSSVSGGSIAAATLAVHWPDLTFDRFSIAENFRDVVVDRLRGLSQHTLDVPAVIQGFITPQSTAQHLAAAYDRYLYNNATLEDVRNASDSAPIFVIQATEIQTASEWYFIAPRMINTHLGVFESGAVPIAVAVASSSALPPFLAPVIIDVSELKLAPDAMTISNLNPEQRALGLADKDLNAYHAKQREIVANRIALVDGGISNNLGTEACYRKERRAFAIVSDARVPERIKVGVFDNWLSLTDRFVNLMYDRKERLIKQDEGNFTELQRALLNAETEEVRKKVTHRLNEMPTFVSLEEDSALDQSGRARRARLRQKLRQDMEDVFRTQEKTSPEAAYVVSGWRNKIKEVSQLSIANAELDDPRWELMGKNAKQAAEAARIETRLQKLDMCIQEHLINVGYAMADAALQSFWIKLFIDDEEKSPTFPASAWDAALIWLYANPGLPYPVRPDLWGDSARGSVECKG